MTYAGAAEGNIQLPEGTQSMIGSYQVTGVVAFAKKMEEEGGFISRPNPVPGTCTSIDL